jgi:prepilin-type N-terminal cleavage/methylation domain-containing protein
MSKSYEPYSRKNRRFVHIAGIPIPRFPSLRRADSRGFSLLETMTVIVVILIVATVAAPIFRTMIVRGREAVLREDLFTLRAQIDRFTHDYARGPERLEGEMTCLTRVSGFPNIVQREDSISSYTRPPQIVARTISTTN